MNPSSTSSLWKLPSFLTFLILALEATLFYLLSGLIQGRGRESIGAIRVLFAGLALGALLIMLTWAVWLVRYFRLRKSD